MARATVVVEKRFVWYREELDKKIDRALGKAAAAGIAAARSTPTKYRIQDVLGSIHVEPAKDYKGGREVAIVASHPLSTIFELGTYQRRRRKLKQPRRSGRANKGVKPGYFLNRGKRIAQATLVPALKDEIGSLR